MKFKRIYAFLLSVILSVVFLVGCTGTDDPPVGPVTPPIEPVAPPEEAMVTIDGARERQLYSGDSEVFTATTDGNGKIVWAVEGSGAQSSISPDGTFTAGDIEETVTVKAYLEENPSVSDSCTVRVIESMLASATPLGTAHNNIIQVRSFTYTFRTYYRVREYGEFAYSFYYDNKLDTTWWNVPNATANRKGSDFTILSAYFADGGAQSDGAVVPGTSTPITFAGERSKAVKSGEEFTSDSVKINIPEGHFLAFSWTLKVASAKAPTVPFTESTFETCFKKNGEFAAQEERDGFVTGNGTFGDQVLVAPNKIQYQRPKGKNLVFLGDSITQGVSTQRDAYEFWVAKVAAQLPATHSVWNLGSGWATAGNLASNGAWLKKAATADELFLCLGVNDLGGNISLEEYQTLINTIIRAVRDKNEHCVITLFTVPPFNYEGSQAQTWHRMNEWIRRHEVEGVDRYFDFAAVLSQPFPKENIIRTEYMSSKSDAHPNGLAGTALAESFLAWYRGDGQSEIQETYDNYVNVDRNEEFALPSKVLVKSADGYYDYHPVTWDKPATTDVAGVQTYTGQLTGSAKQVTYTVRVRNAVSKETLYFVNCGNFLETNTEYLNSVWDREFGVDAATGKSWGCVNEIPYKTNVFWENNSSYWWAIRSSADNPAGGYYEGILYRFELEKGDYILSFGFQDPWNVRRTMKVTADGVVLDEAMSNGGGAQTTHNYNLSVAQEKVVEILLRDVEGTGSAVNWISVSYSTSPSDNDITGAVAGDGYAKLTWSNAIAASEYELVYGTQQGQYTSAPIVTTQCSATVAGLQNGTPYYFAVRAKNAAGYGGYSNEVCVIPQERTRGDVVYHVDCGFGGIIPLGNDLGTLHSE